MEKNPTSVIQFRIKLLSAICQMQSAIGVKDLGNFYYKPLKDSQGTIILSCVNNIKVSPGIHQYSLPIDYCFLSRLFSVPQKHFRSQFTMDSIKKNSKKTHASQRRQHHK